MPSDFNTLKVTSRRRLWLLLTFWLLPWVAGCGSSSESFVFTGTAPDAPANTATVRLESVLAQTTVDAEVDSFRVSGYDDTNALLYGPITKTKSTTVDFEGVSVRVRRLVIEHIINDQAQGVSQVPVSLTPGQTTTVSNPPSIPLFGRLTGLAITPQAPRLAQGTSLRVELDGLAESGDSANLATIALWTSADSAVAKVDQSGLVKGVSAGTTTIRSVVGGLVTEETVIVTDAMLVNLTIEQDYETLPSSVSTPLTVEGFFSDGSIQDVTDDVNWSSSDPQVAGIESNGVLSGTGIGQAIITATLGSESVAREIDFVSGDLLSINVVGRNLIAPYSDNQYFAVGQYSSGPSDIPLSGASWSVNPSGGVILSPLPHSIVLRAANSGSLELKAEFNGVIGVETVRVSGFTALSVESDRTTFATGTRHQLGAMAVFSDQAAGTTSDQADGSIDIAEQAAWRSSNPAVATVRDGVVSFHSEGQAVISAQAMGVTGPLNAELTVGASDATLQALDVSSGTHTFNTSNGQYDGTVLPGWSNHDGLLILSRFQIADGATLILQGDGAFRVSAEDFSVAGTLRGERTERGSVVPGQRGYTARVYAKTVTVRGSVNMSGGGGAAATQSGAEGGRGGRGGSFVALASSNLVLGLPGTISVSGGDGGPGGLDSQGLTTGNGGDGGNAGLIRLQAGLSVRFDGTVEAHGGQGGSAVPGSDKSCVGGAGGDGGLVNLKEIDQPTLFFYRGIIRADGGNAGITNSPIPAVTGPDGRPGGQGGEIRVQTRSFFCADADWSAVGGNGNDQAGLFSFFRAGNGGAGGLLIVRGEEGINISTSAKLKFVGGQGGNAATPGLRSGLVCTNGNGGAGGAILLFAPNNPSFPINTGALTNAAVAGGQAGQNQAEGTQRGEPGMAGSISPPVSPPN